jgi:plasmid stabilization system protein ParE
MRGNIKKDVEYTEHSVQLANEIVNYLNIRFSEKEVTRFFKLLIDFERIVSIFPTLYPVSSQINVRRAILSKELAVYYTVTKSKINVVAIIDNRWDMRKED